MKKKKVAILNPYLPTLGGGEKHMGLLCQFIEEYYNYNVEIDILVHNYNDIDVFADDYVTIEQLNQQFDLSLQKTKIKPLNIRKEVSREDVRYNRKLVENASKGYDLFVNLMFLSRHVGRAKKNIYECMFPQVSYSMESKPGIIRHVWAKLKDKRFLSCYDAVISISKFTASWFERYWDGAPKSYVVYPPVFSEKEIENRYVEADKKNIIISVGRFFVASHSKKQLEMVQFFVNHQEELGGYEYHLCGAVSTKKADVDYLQQIKRLASTVNNVFIHENCPFNQLMALYRQAKIFWHATGYLQDEEKEPQKMEHFGITTVEAMSYGVVPVVINKGGQRETVQNGQNGYRWDTEDECVQKTKQLIEDDQLRIKMAEDSVEKAKLYSIEKFYEGNRNIFDEYKI